MADEPTADRNGWRKTIADRAETMVRFLAGEGPFRGTDLHFGDNHPRLRGRFWWRSELAFINEALAELRAMTADRNGWLPIESAPKDGTWVLVGRSDWATPLRAANIDGRWWNEACGAFGMLVPSHWMPLPSPPEVQP